MYVFVQALALRACRRRSELALRCTWRDGRSLRQQQWPHPCGREQGSHPPHAECRAFSLLKHADRNPWQRCYIQPVSLCDRRGTTLNYAPGQQSVPLPPPTPLPNHRPPFCHPERSRGICFAPFSCHKFLHELRHRTRRGTILSAGMHEIHSCSEAAAIETHVPLPIRCWSSCRHLWREKGAKQIPRLRSG